MTFLTKSSVIHQKISQVIFMLALSWADFPDPSQVPPSTTITGPAAWLSLGASAACFHRQL